MGHKSQCEPEHDILVLLMKAHIRRAFANVKTRQNLRYSHAIKSRASNFCAIYASTEGSAEFAYLRRLAWASTFDNAISTKLSRAGSNGDLSATYVGSAYVEICDIIKYLVISQNRICDITKYNLWYKKIVTICDNTK